MKKFLLPLVSLAALALLPSCSEKFNIAAPYKNITVIYGLLDRADTAHYVRIQKAFLDDNISALTMAKNSDSNFFSSLDVVIKKIDFKGRPLGTTTLQRVDLTAEGYPKEPGAFFNSPNYAYKFTGDIDPSAIYRLVVRNNASGETDSADAPVIDDKNLSSFYVYLIDDSGTTQRPLDFASSNQYQTVTIGGRYTPPFDFSFQGYTTPVGMVQAILQFNWVDSNTVSGGTSYHSYNYDLGNTGITTAFSYKPKNISLQGALKAALGPAPDNTVRLLDRCRLSIYLGTYDFATYINAQSIQGTGLTGNEIQPVHTNIKGANALGLFTSRALRSGPVTLSSNTVDSLKASADFEVSRIKGTFYH
ncbi:MAG: hypothetical protein H7257_06085 [Taibaiella sp.]|nr:hypothetical protein [Taibaiella sp.]